MPIEVSKLKIYYAMWEPEGDEPIVLLGRSKKDVKTKLWATVKERVGAENAGDSLNDYLEGIEGCGEYIVFGVQEV